MPRRPRATAPAEAPPAPVTPPRPPVTELPTEVLRQFRVVFNAVRTHFRQVERSVQLGGARVWALAVVQAQPGIGMKGLAQAMDVHPSTASNLVRALVALDLLATETDPTDRRAVRLRLRPAGARVLRRAPRPFAGVLPDALQALDEPTLRRLHRDLRQLIAQLGADERASQTPLAEL